MPLRLATNGNRRAEPRKAIEIHPHHEVDRRAAAQANAGIVEPSVEV